jgi:hypothetical protein
MQLAFLAALEMRMKILIVIELIIGAIFVVAFWYKSPELVLSRYSGLRLLDPYDDAENDDARAHSAMLLTQVIRVSADSHQFGMDPHP